MVLLVFGFVLNVMDDVGKLSMWKVVSLLPLQVLQLLKYRGYNGIYLNPF